MEWAINLPGNEPKMMTGNHTEALKEQEAII